MVGSCGKTENRNRYRDIFKKPIPKPIPTFEKPTKKLKTDTDLQNRYRPSSNGRSSFFSLMALRYIMYFRFCRRSHMCSWWPGREKGLYWKNLTPWRILKLSRQGAALNGKWSLISTILIVMLTLLLILVHRFAFCQPEMWNRRVFVNSPVQL